MKKKLMAIIIATSLIGGIGTTTYASVDNVKKSVVLSNISCDTANKDTNTSQCGTSSNEYKNEADNINQKDENFFKFISIKVNGIVMDIQEFFDSIFGNKHNIDNNNSNNNIKEDSATGKIGQDKGDSQDRSDVPEKANQVKSQVEKIQDNSQENEGVPSIGVDNSGKDVNEGNGSDSGNNNSNIVVNPNVEQNPSASVNTNVEQNPSVSVKPNIEQNPSVSVKPDNKPNTGDNSTVTTTTVQNNNFMATVEQMIFNKVNEERAKAGVPALSYNNVMQKYARIKSQDMGDKNYFSHNDLQGNLMTAKMKADGVSYNAWGENIAYIGGTSDASALASQFMTNWMNSQGHRENILSTKFTSIGVGVYKVGNKVYATQEFYK